MTALYLPKSGKLNTQNIMQELCHCLQFQDTSAIKRVHAIRVRVVPKGTIQMEVSSFGQILCD